MALPLQVVKFLYVLLVATTIAIAMGAIQLAAPSHVLTGETTSVATSPVWPSPVISPPPPMWKVESSVVESSLTVNRTADCKPVEAGNWTYTASWDSCEFNATYLARVFYGHEHNLTMDHLVVLEEVGRGGASFFEALRLVALALGVALFLYGAYLAKCRGAECLLDRAKSLLYLSAATIAASLAALPSQPLAALPAAVGVYGLWRFYVGMRRVRKWLSTTLT